MAYMLPPQQGIPRLLAMKDPANPILMHMSPMEAAQITTMRGQGFNPQTGLPVLGRAAGGMLQPEKPPYADIAEELEEKGRFGDTHLLHVRDDELQGLSSLGKLTINPDTGLPEAFSFKSLLPAVGAIAGAALAPFTFGTSMWAVGAMAGLGSFAGGLAAGQGVGQAALGGLMSGVTAGFMSGAPTGIEALGSEGIMSGAGELGVEAAMTGVGEAVGQTAIPGALGSTTASITGSTAANAASALPRSGAGIGELVVEGGIATGPMSIPPIPIATQAANQTALANQAANIATRQGLTTTAPNIPAEAFARVTPQYKAPSELRQFFGADDLSKVSGDNLGGGFLTKQEFIDAGGIPSDVTLGERAGQLATSPGTYLGLASSVLSQPPENNEFVEEDLSLSSSYVPRKRTLEGGQQRPFQTTEEIRNRFIQGGDAQPLTSNYRYVKEGGLVGLSQGGMPNEYTSYNNGGAIKFNNGGAIGSYARGGTLTDSQQKMLRDAMRMRESSGDYSIRNKLGYVGGYQFGAMALEDLGYLKKGSSKKGNKAMLDSNNWTGKDNINSLDNFYADESLQDDLFDKYTQRNFKQLKNKNKINEASTPEHIAGMLAASHLLGATGASKSLENADASGTKGTEYYDLGSSSIKESLLQKQENLAEQIISGGEQASANDSDEVEQETTLDTITNFLTPNREETISKGDTLTSIANKYDDVSIEDIAKANNIQDINRIQIGQKLNIPGQGSILDTLGSFIPFAQGGGIGQYYEGQVVGRGDGMSDQILFEVEGNNPDKALLSRDEYVIPADVVAMLGNGSSNAGAEQLDNFMKGIRQQSFGTTKQQKQMNPQQGLSQLV